MHVVTAGARRRVETPNGTMTTLASPTLGGAQRSVWIVELSPDVVGPEHAFEDEVVWTVTEGRAEVTCGEGSATLLPGDTAILPGGVMRQFAAGPDGFKAVATTSAPGRVQRGDDGSSVIPDWVA